MEDELYHIGTPQEFDFDPHGSGRYRQGSGENPNQHFSGDRFEIQYRELKSKKLPEKKIAELMGYKSTKKFRADVSINKERQRAIKYETGQKLEKEHPDWSRSKVASELGIPESSYRALIKSMENGTKDRASKVADNLQSLVDKHGAIDVGKGSNLMLGCSREKENAALEILKQKGYEVSNFRFRQVTNPKQTTEFKVLHKPELSYDYIHKNRQVIKPINDLATFEDSGDSMYKLNEYPSSMEKKRLAIRFSDGMVANADGTVYSGISNDPKKSGTAKDGLIEVRRGCKDLDFGPGENYCQARILVNETHYIKGMAVYSDDLPDGVDVLFNTNKDSSIPVFGSKNSSVLKPIKKDDPDNPFGSALKMNGGQSYYPDPNGKYKNAAGEPMSLSLINKRAEEDDWNDWSNKLPAQFLSKQNVPLIRRQLNLALADKEKSLKEIRSLTNPEVKASFLDEFADSCDTESVHLRAAALPGQRYQVILPLTTIADNECYAPNWPNGTKVVLIRYPHGGIFEIPTLTVNNNNKEGKEHLSSIQTARDAIGITKKTADRLSGADFDGDTVMVVPLSNDFKINTTKDTLPGLKGFDPSSSYGCDPSLTYVDDEGVSHYFRNGIEFKPMNKTSTQKEMGIVSNLITDMTLQNATAQEMERAVRHSMVVIDAEKHHLDYKASERENGIEQLKQKYQYHKKGVDKNGEDVYGKGAATLVSRAKAEVYVPERKEGLFVIKDTGKPVVDDEGKGTNSKTFLDPETGNRLKRADVKELFIDPKTGKKLYHETGREEIKVTYIDDDGNKQTVKGYSRGDDIIYKKSKTDEQYMVVTNEKVTKNLALQKVSQMSETDDAFELSRGTPQEKLYAEYANRLKNMANQARLEELMINDTKYSKQARELYRDQYNSLKEKVEKAEINAPYERQAQLMADGIINATVADDPTLYSDKERYKKLKTRIINNCRLKVGAKRNPVEVTPKEWEAIQSGAIASDMIKKILKYADKDKLKELSMPKKSVTVTKGMETRMANLAKRGYTMADIARSLGVSVSTVDKYLKGAK